MVRRPQEKFSRTSREHQCSGTAAKRTGSTVYTVLPFFISPADLLSCARFLTHRGFPMTLHDSVRDRLRAIEALLRETEHWQETAPDSSAFASDKPFCWIPRSRWVAAVGPDPAYAPAAGERPAAAAKFCRCALLRNGSGSGPPGPRIHAGGTSAVRRAVCR